MTYFRGVDFDEKGNLVTPGKRLEYRATVPEPQLLKYFPEPSLPAYRATELDKMPEGFFNDLVRRVASEVVRRERDIRYNKAQVEKDQARRAGLLAGFQNFLLGCAHAMACRAALRWSAGHVPYGKSPMSGTPWHALDGAKLSEMVTKGTKFSTTTPDAPGIKDWPGTRLWSNPLLWKNKTDLKLWLKEKGARMLARGAAHMSHDTRPEYLN